MSALPYDGTGLRPKAKPVEKKVATKKAASNKKAATKKDSAQESED